MSNSTVTSFDHGQTSVLQRLCPLAEDPASVALDGRALPLPARLLPRLATGEPEAEEEAPEAVAELFAREQILPELRHHRGPIRSVSQHLVRCRRHHRPPRLGDGPSFANTASGDGRGHPSRTAGLELRRDTPAVGEPHSHLAPLGLPDEFVQERAHGPHLENREDDRRPLARPGRETHDCGVAVYNLSAEFDLVVQPKSETRLPDLLCQGLAPLDVRGSLVRVVRGRPPMNARILRLASKPAIPRNVDSADSDGGG